MKRSYRPGTIVTVLLIVSCFLVLPAGGLTASVSGFPQIKSGKAADVDISSTISGGTPPYHCTLGSGESLPDGLILQDDCTISGTHTLRQGATEEVSPSFTVEVTDSASPPGTTRFSLSIMTRAASPTLLPETGRCIEKTPCTTKVAGAWGGTPPYHFQSGSFANGAPPMGLVVDLNGNLKGTAPAAGTYSFSICVVDSVGESGCGTSTVVIGPATTPSPDRSFREWLSDLIPGLGTILGDTLGNPFGIIPAPVISPGVPGPVVTASPTRTSAGCSGTTPYYYDGSCHARPRTTPTTVTTTWRPQVSDICVASAQIGSCEVSFCSETTASGATRGYYRSSRGNFYCNGYDENMNCVSAAQRLAQACI